MRRRCDAVPLQRVSSIDDMRGLCLLLMAMYHLVFDLVSFGVLVVDWVENPLADFYVVCVASAFIFISGMCSSLSRSNLRRGLELSVAAGLVTAVSFAAGTPIWWGILHFMAAEKLLYAAFGRFIKKLPSWTMWLFLLLWSGMLWLVFDTVEVRGLWLFGLRNEDFFTADYFPLVPWGFMFISGAVFGNRSFVNGKLQLPDRLHCAPLELLGRHSLAFYLLHQPMLMGAAYLIAKFRCGV